MRINSTAIKHASIAIYFLGCTLQSFAQAPAREELKRNDINRIDSLTMALYSEIPSHIPATNEWEQDLTEESFNSAMKHLGSSIPFDYHETVVKNIKYFSRLSPEYYDRMHERMSLYFPVFEEILDKNNLPTELKYVSIIESALNPNAVSWCGATGLWQFMPYTGKNMGMKINYTIDERKSILTSTQKASDYFKNSYGLFDDWLLAIASYNCGPGNVQKALRRAGGEKKNFWEIMRFLPKETRNYIPKFIAMAYVLNFTEHARRDRFNQTTEYLVPTKIDSSLHFNKMCEYLAGDDKKKLMGLNCELIKPNTQYATNKTVLLPYEYSMSFISDNDSLLSHALLSKKEINAMKGVRYGNTGRRYHVVRRGETLSHLSYKYGISVKQLMRINGLRNSRIRIGQRLKVGGYSHRKNHR